MSFSQPEITSLTLKISKIGNMRYKISHVNNIFLLSLLKNIPNSSATKDKETQTIKEIYFYCENLIPFHYNYYGDYTFKSIIMQQTYLEQCGYTMINMNIEDLYIIDDLLICLNGNNIRKIRNRDDITHFYYKFGLFLNKLYPKIINYSNKIGSFIKRLLHCDKNKRFMILI
jgi:hypothetical protein